MQATRPGSSPQPAPPLMSYTPREILIAKLDKTYRTAANYGQIKDFLLEWAEATGVFDYNVLLNQPEVMLQMHFMLYRAVQHAKQGVYPNTLRGSSSPGTDAASLRRIATTAGSADSSANPTPSITPVTSVPGSPSSSIATSAGPSTACSSRTASDGSEEGYAPSRLGEQSSKAAAAGAKDNLAQAPAKASKAPSSKPSSAHGSIPRTPAPAPPVDSPSEPASPAKPVDTPADTPAADTPAADTPAADTPAADTPAADTSPSAPAQSPATMLIRSSSIHARLPVRKPALPAAPALPPEIHVTENDGMLDGGEALPGETQRAAAARRLNLQHSQRASPAASIGQTISNALNQQAAFLRLLEQWAEPADSLLRRSLQALLPAKPQLAKRLTAQTLEQLAAMPKEQALLLLYQLLLTEGQLQSVTAYVSRCAQKLEEHFALRPECSLEQDPGLWESMAGGEVGSPLPLCLVVWNGPAKVKALLQKHYPDPHGPLAAARLRPLHLASLVEMGEAQALQVLGTWLASPFATSVTLSLKLGCTDAALAMRIGA